MESLSTASTAGVLLDLAAVLILLCSFACLGSKLLVATSPITARSR